MSQRGTRGKADDSFFDPFLPSELVFITIKGPGGLQNSSEEHIIYLFPICFRMVEAGEPGKNEISKKN